ncbi:MAG: hypothetical protein NC483_00195 [Ruminococcus sp.]|nr:hypothetical protein [Ruminococcus sp.]
MHKLIKNIIEKLENEGFEAYIVGGYVRDLLLGKSSFDIDICTNATPKELIKIFPNSTTRNLGGIEFKKKEYNFEITTYRKEIEYSNRRPIKFNYVNNLVEDLNRRDFRMNAICMNKNGDIIDLLKGTKDIRDKKVKMIGDITLKIKEDPLRIMRALRFAIVLDFNLDKELYKVIKKEKALILTLSNTRIKAELDKILLSENIIKGLNLLKELGIIELLGISYDKIIPVKNIEAMYAQIDINYNIPFTKVEKEHIRKLKEIIKSDKINSFTIYKYGLYLSQVGASILNISKKMVNKIYKDMPIKERNDIDIDAQEIINIIGQDNANKVSKILGELENNIISGKIINKQDVIVRYIANNKERWLK